MLVGTKEISDECQKNYVIMYILLVFLGSVNPQGPEHTAKENHEDGDVDWGRDRIWGI